MWILPGSLKNDRVHAGCEKYSTAIDVWSLGCIMAELLTKRVLFDGNGELGQIDKIFKVLGTPTEETWPGYRKLPNVTKVLLSPRRNSNLIHGGEALLTWLSSASRAADAFLVVRSLRGEPCLMRDCSCS